MNVTKENRIESIRIINNNLKKYHLDIGYDAIKTLKKILLEYIIDGNKITTSISFPEINKYVNIKLCRYNINKNIVFISLKPKHQLLQE